MRLYVYCIFCITALALAGTQNIQNMKTGRNEFLDSRSPRLNLTQLTPCLDVNPGFGKKGSTFLRAEKVVSGLEVPWGVAVLPESMDWLVTERTGAVRLVREARLISKPVTVLNTAEGGEGGLLGIAIDPEFSKNAYFYVYYTAAKTGGNVNRVERFKLSPDHAQATFDRLILDNISASPLHNGGRIKFGPDRLLYIGTGDARKPELSQDSNSLNGKILRLTNQGAIPLDNPEPGKAWFIKGLRNVQAFDWIDAQALIIADHGPSGEYLGRLGGDEVSIAHKGDNLGWPTIWRCVSKPGLVTPVLSWIEAVPPGGGLVYQGEERADWKGNFIIGTLGSRHLHRVVLSSSKVSSHEVYLEGDPPQGLGRIRDVFLGALGELYVTTSNCDGRGNCPPEKDGIYRIRFS